MTSGECSVPATPRAVDNGRVLVLVGAVILTTISYALWCRSGDERIREQPLLLLFPMAICAVPLMSRRLGSALAILSGTILLALCFVYGIFGGMVYFPEVLMLFVAAVPAWSRLSVTVAVSLLAAVGLLTQPSPTWRDFGWMATGVATATVLYPVAKIARLHARGTPQEGDRSPSE